MHSVLMLCIPGTWKDRTDFLTRVVKTTKGEFLFAGMILAQPSKNRHTTLEFCEPHPDLAKAFETAGQGKLSAEFLSQVSYHQSVVYLHFNISFIEEREKIIDFTQMMRHVGGIGVKVESAGVAHDWDNWFKQISSENPFDWYRGLVTLIGDREYFYSCGMHHFCLPDVEVSREVNIREAADLMNRFNYWQIDEEPKVESGHTFSLAVESPWFRLEHVTDQRYEPDNLFHNPHGIWRLHPV